MIVMHVHDIYWLHGGMHTCMILLKVHIHCDADLSEVVEMMVMVMIVMHVHEMFRWYDGYGCMFEKNSIDVSYIYIYIL